MCLVTRQLAPSSQSKRRVGDLEVRCLHPPRTPDSSRSVELADEEIMDQLQDSTVMDIPFKSSPFVMPRPHRLNRREVEWEVKVRQRSNYANLWNNLIEITTRRESRVTAKKVRAVKRALEKNEIEEKSSKPFAGIRIVPELDEQLETVEKTENIGNVLMQILATITTLASSVILSSASTKRSLSHGGSSAQELEGHDPGKLGSDLNHLLSMSNPSPVALGIAMLAYGAGTSTIYHLNRNDRLQDTILTMGISLGLIAGMLVGHKFEAMILHVLPWAVFLALWLSALGHRIARAVVRKREIFEEDSIV